MIFNDIRTALAAVPFFLFLTVHAQTDTTIFNAIKKVEVMEYVLPLPDKWQKVDRPNVSTVDRKFDFTGVSLPQIVNNTPLRATFTLRKYECANIRPAEDYVITEFTGYPDRITPKGYNYEKDSLAITSGERGPVYITHYYRRTEALNYTCYYFIVYSKKRKAAYMLTATYQYRDANYEVEKKYQFKQYAYRVFKGLILR